MAPGAQEELKARIEKLALQPNDLVIVRDPDDMETFIHMVQQGVGFSPYSNPVLLIRGGLEKASREDLLEALSVVDQHAAERARAKVTDAASAIITDINAPFLKRIN